MITYIILILSIQLVNGLKILVMFIKLHMVLCLLHLSRYDLPLYIPKEDPFLGKNSSTYFFF